VSSALLLLVPLGALGYLALIGAGLAAWMSPRFPADAQAALAVLVGAALVAVASALVPLGVAARPLTVAVAAGGALVTAVLARRVLVLLRAGAVPLAVAVCAVCLAGAPALARGSWQATSLFGSTDPYHWSSQARQYQNRPTASPFSDHPDRLTYERSKTQHWAFALPFGDLQIAWLTGADPPDVYEALAAVVFALLPLAAFACARACFRWRGRWAAAAALLVVADANLLYASHFSWQQQLAGTAFLFGAAVGLRLALEPGAPRREALLAAFLAAASLASYRLGFSPYFVGLLGVVVAGYALARRGDLVRIGRRLVGFIVAFGALGAPSIAAVLLGIHDFYASGSFSTKQKREFADGQIAEALGLVPRLWARQDGWSRAVTIAWLAVASVAAAVLLLYGYRALRRAGLPRADFLAAGVGVTLVLYCVFLLPSFASYLSFKVLAYGAPFLLLLVVLPAALGRPWGALALAAAVGLLIMPSTAVATAIAVDKTKTPGELSALARVSLPRDATVSVALDDPWQQAWAVYYLRAHRISVEHASFVLTGEGRHRDPALFRHRPVNYVVTDAPVGKVIWRRGRLDLSACPRAAGDRTAAAACG
jgi:hypothetical protein